MLTRRALIQSAVSLCAPALAAQVIEFESGGLRYLTQTRNGVTVMFAPLPLLIRDYTVIQVAIANGSSQTCEFKPEAFWFQRDEAAPFQGIPANDIVREFMRSGGRDDVVKLVSAYEGGLYGMSRGRSTNGYEARRQAAMAEVQSTRLKAAAAASAIVLVQMKLKPGESTDGAVFFQAQGKPLGRGTLMVEGAGTRFLFDHDR